MPTHESIQNTVVIPKTVEKPIPTRTVTTKARLTVPENTEQQITNNSPAASPATPEESVRLSPQLSAIARKEQALVKERLAIKAEREQLASKLANADRYEQLQAKMDAKDYSEAEALGLTYDEYTKYVLEKQNGEDPVKSEIQALKAEIEALKKGSEESAASLYEQTVEEYKKEISKLVSENPEFSSIKELKKEDAVLQVILDTFEEDDEELSVSEAAKLVEDQLEQYGKAFVALPKFKKEEVVLQKALPRPMVGKTLTNDMTATSEKRPYVSLQNLSEAERYAEARRRVLERREKGK